MKKRILAALVASATVLSLAGCNNGGTSSTNNSSDNKSSDTKSSDTKTDASTTTPELPADTGKKLRIACWNYEFAEFFDAYYKAKLPSDITVEWVQFPNEGKNYQDNLDRLLKANESASADDKIDMFLAEADYIKKYVNSDVSLDVKSIGVTNTSNAYQYVLDAATTDSDNVLKGVSFQACPGAVIVRKSIAKDVLGTDDPAEIQSKIDTWEKFNAVAKDAKSKGYLMTPSAIETYRAFANNATESYLNNNKFAPTQAFKDWYAQAKDFVDNGYTLTCKLWDQEKTNEMMKDGKAMCFFGPMWYYAFSMSTAVQETPGDWCIVKGPAAYFWGGTWMLAAKGTDNANLVASVMDAFMNDEEVVNKLVKSEGLKAFSNDGVATNEDKNNPCFVNNKAVVKKYAEDTTFGNTALLDGQNDFAVMADIADSIVWRKELHTVYDQTFNEALPEALLESLKKDSGVDEATAWNNFYTTLAGVDPSITHD